MQAGGSFWSPGLVSHETLFHMFHSCCGQAWRIHRVWGLGERRWLQAREMHPLFTLGGRGEHRAPQILLCLTSDLGA